MLTKRKRTRYRQTPFMRVGKHRVASRSGAQITFYKKDGVFEDAILLLHNTTFALLVRNCHGIVGNSDAVGL